MAAATKRHSPITLLLVQGNSLTKNNAGVHYSISTVSLNDVTGIVLSREYK